MLPANAIDASIVGAERELVADYLLSLPEGERENAILVDENGKMHSNRKSLLKTFDVFASTGVDGKVKSLTTGQVRSMALPSDPAPSFDINTNDSFSAQAATDPVCASTTGPFRRIYSPPGYAWASANIHFPNGVGSSKDVFDQANGGPTGEIAYIYLGGWSVVYDSSLKTNKLTGAIDAGFQHGGNATQDNWAPGMFIQHPNGSVFLNTDTALDVAHSSTLTGRKLRFRGDSDVFAKFYVSKDSLGRVYTNFYASGYDLSDTKDASGKITGAKFYITISSVDYKAPDGETVPKEGYKWSASGGNVLKRMTTIAQPKQNFKSGSYLKNVKWSNAQISISSTDTPQPWGTALSAKLFCNIGNVTAPAVSTAEVVSIVNQ